MLVSNQPPYAVTVSRNSARGSPSVGIPAILRIAGTLGHFALCTRLKASLENAIP